METNSDTHARSRCSAVSYVSQVHGCVLQYSSQDTSDATRTKETNLACEGELKPCAFALHYRYILINAHHTTRLLCCTQTMKAHHSSSRVSRTGSLSTPYAPRSLQAGSSPTSQSRPYHSLSDPHLQQYHRRRLAMASSSSKRPSSSHNGKQLSSLTVDMFKVTRAR